MLVSRNGRQAAKVASSSFLFALRSRRVRVVRKACQGAKESLQPSSSIREIRAIRGKTPFSVLRSQVFLLRSLRSLRRLTGQTLDANVFA
jgi:hypothetical protein